MTRIVATSLCLFACVSSPSSCLAVDRIVFDRIGPTEATLFISNADGSAERPLTQPDSLDYNPSWSQTGDWIVFTSERAGSADLFRVHPDGTGLERLTEAPAYDDQAAFLPMAPWLCSFPLAPAEGQTSGLSIQPATRPRRSLQETAAISVLRGLPPGHGSPFRRIATATFRPRRADGKACTWWTFISFIPMARG